MKENSPIDIVVLWVDGKDPEWIKEFNKWSTDSKKEGIDSREERYRDYGLLKYWFRGVEKYTPWINKIHFVTCGQIPEWLNENNPKLHLVNHKDYIPQEYLPVFSANPIELMMHKIPGLSENFIFFNDDFFVTAPIRKEFFFKNGIPCDYAGFCSINIGITRIPHMIVNDLIEINRNFSKKQILKKHWYKWLSFNNGHHLIKTLCTLPFKKIDGISMRHHPQPYTKKTLEEVWEKCPEVLNKTMTHRFRNTIEDVNQWLFRYWNLCKGNFIPKKCYKDEHFFKLSEMKNSDLNAIKNNKFKVICIDDDLDESSCNDYDLRIQKLVDSFEKILPEKSSFEL